MSSLFNVFQDRIMKLYIAGIESHINIVFKEKPKYVLYSYAYQNDKVLKYVKSEHCKEFILDSGAFTFLNKKKEIDFVKYAEEYANYVKENNIKNFIELDLYNIIGIEKTEKIRQMIEEITNKKTIPVFHRSLGIDYFHKLIKEYPYIAIGGLASKDIAKHEYKYLEYFVREAKKTNTKIHGLGLTAQKAMKEYKFDSVDSTTWIRGRYGDIYYFDNGKMKTYKKKNSRLKDTSKANQFCLNQWIKFQKYAELYL